LSDIALALSENGDQLLDNIGDKNNLSVMNAAFRSELNKLIAHAIRVADREIDPPAHFIPNPNLPPLPLPFTKRKFSANPDLDLFQGHWINSNPNGLIQSLSISALDATHIAVTAKYRGFQGDFLSKADWDPAAKVFAGGVTLVPGVTSVNNATLPIFSNYTVASPTATGTAVVVTNQQGTILDPTSSVDTFNRN